MSDSELPVGVVMPTLNVRHSLGGHLSQMRTWADRVQQIVVVDSYSTDGTLELLQAELKHPNLRLLQHPPGLYQSWNYGIQQVTAKYTYISTIGDTITFEGLVHLVGTAEELCCEAVLSRPQLLDAAGQLVADRHWPLDKLLQTCPLRRPVRLEPWQVFLLAMLEAPESILGSSASNLYLTDTLKRCPFPTEYGHAGDTAWGIRHAWCAALAVTPGIFSTFSHDPETSRLPPEACQRLQHRFYALAGQTARECLAQRPADGAVRQLLLRVCDLPPAIQSLFQVQQQYYQVRREFWPWFCNPGAWAARAQRNRVRAQTLRIKEEIRRDLDLTLGSGDVSGPAGGEQSDRALAGYLRHRLEEWVR